MKFTLLLLFSISEFLSRDGNRSLTKNVTVFSSESKFFSPYQNFLGPETLHAKYTLGDNL